MIKFRWLISLMCGGWIFADYILMATNASYHLPTTKAGFGAVLILIVMISIASYVYKE